MKNIKILSLLIIGFIIISPNFSKNALATTEIGTYSISGESGWYYIWNITEVINDESEFFIINPLSAGDKFRITIIGYSVFPCYAYYENGDYQVSIGDNPCIIGALDHYDKYYDQWNSYNPYSFFPIGTGRSANNYAMLMYNQTSGLLWTANYLATKYFLTVLPVGLNLSELGNTLTNKYSKISNYSSTSNTLNLTLSQWEYNYTGDYYYEVSRGYNYIEVDTNGIVSKWEYNFSNSKIVAEYESSGINPNPFIPFGSEYIIPAGIAGTCIIGLIYLVKKRSILNKKKL
ncbi:MAG: hypothetical protein ACFFBP_09285 [Promethearchaeota archaeon]